MEHEITDRAFNELRTDVAGATACSRCGGLMVIEQCVDLRDDTGHFDFWARRCVQCGEVIDPVILQNRQQQLPVSCAGGRSGPGFSESTERI